MHRLLFIFSFITCFGRIEDHFKKIENKHEDTAIRNIDYIYLINLDGRNERWNRSLAQLVPYGILPQRFSAIYGWHLPISTFNDIGVRFSEEMWIGPENVLYFPPNRHCTFVRLGPEFYGKTVFSGWLTPGAVGCTLSHLSILQDAWDSGYETIWILEDDFHVVDNPHLISERIDQMDEIAEHEGWDILYTDPDYLFVDENRDLHEQLPMKWRPDMPNFKLEPLLEHTEFGDHFYKIGSRNRTHSMILRRSGIEKILTFYKERQIFLPYDHELGFIPNIRLFVIKEPIVETIDITSDTKNKNF